jgi:hypothetical protein
LLSSYCYHSLCFIISFMPFIHSSHTLLSYTPLIHSSFMPFSQGRRVRGMQRTAGMALAAALRRQANPTSRDGADGHSRRAQLLMVSVCALLIAGYPPPPSRY